MHQPRTAPGRGIRKKWGMGMPPGPHSFLSNTSAPAQPRCLLDIRRPRVYHASVNKLFLTLLAAGCCLTAPLCAAPAATAQPAPLPSADKLEESLHYMVSVVLPSLEAISDKASAEAAVVKLEEARPHLLLITHVLMDELSREEESLYLPIVAPRLSQLLAQLDTCCRLSAEMLSSKPQAFGSERLAHALTGLLDTFTTGGESSTQPEDIPLALAEADAQIAAMHALLASLERLRDAATVAQELPTIRAQMDSLRAIQQGLADSSRWSPTQLFLIMQRMKQRGAEVSTDLGKSAAHLMGQSPSCFGSAELEELLGSLINSPRSSQP